jgi:hypothetical protein
MAKFSRFARGQSVCFVPFSFSGQLIVELRDSGNKIIVAANLG